MLPLEASGPRALERRGSVGAAGRFRCRPAGRERDELSAPGEILLYPGGVSETEILIPYGRTNFASKAGQLAGNHFLTIVSGVEHLRELGRRRSGRARSRSSSRAREPCSLFAPPWFSQVSTVTDEDLMTAVRNGDLAKLGPAIDLNDTSERSGSKLGVVSR